MIIIVMIILVSMTVVIISMTLLILMMVIVTIGDGRDVFFTFLSNGGTFARNIKVRLHAAINRADFVS